jgi:carboxyl-terminal processing protease
MKLAAAILLTVAIGLCLCNAVQAEPRVALVIGNSNYGGDLGVLPNPVNDAALMAKTLAAIGFSVIEAEDADQNAMKHAISDFGEKLANAGTGAVGLFFYAGHGLQVSGTNYLIPVHANIKREPDVDIEAVPVDLVLREMDYAGSTVNIVILDACRNNPLSRGFRSMTRGLAEIDTKPKGSFIAYSTAPGEVAMDGNGKNSPYTTALAETISKPGVDLNDVFQEVRGKVLAATDEKQTPWDASSLTAPFFFVPAALVQPAPAPAVAAGGGDDKQIDLAFWESIKDSKSPDDFQAYLTQFPEGVFAGLAKIRMKALSDRASSNASATAAPAAPTVNPIEQMFWESVKDSTSADDLGLYLQRYPNGQYSALAQNKIKQLSQAMVASTPRSTDAQAGGTQVAAAAPPPAPAVGNAPTTASQAPASPSAPSIAQDEATCVPASGQPVETRAAACQRLLDSGKLNDSDHTSALVDLGIADYDGKQYDGATRTFHDVLGRDPNNVAAYFYIGLMHVEQDEYPEARNAFDKAAKLQPANAEILFRLGSVTADLGDFDTALTDLSGAVAIKGDDWRYLDGRAAVFLEKGDVVAASADIDRVLVLNQGYWGDTGVFAEYFGAHYDRALAVIERAIKGDPDYEYWWLWKALVQKASGDNDGAQATLAAAMKQFGDGDWPAPLLKFAAGRITEATLRQAANGTDSGELAGRLSEIDFYRGELAYLAGDTETARAAMTDVIGAKMYEYLEYDGAHARLALLKK